MYAGRGTVGPKAEREEISEAYDVNRSEGKETGESNSVLHDSRSSTLSRTHIFQGEIRFSLFCSCIFV